MTREQLTGAVALAIAIAAAIGAATVAQTWDRSMTLVLVGGVLAIGGLVGVAGVLAGVYLVSQRHQAQARPLAPYVPSHQVADPLTVHRALELEAKTAAMKRQAELDGWQGGYQISTYSDRLTAEREEAETWG